MATPDATAAAAAAAVAEAPEGGEESPLAGGPKKQADEQTHGLEKVTDYVEELEITAELGQVRRLEGGHGPDHRFLVLLLRLSSQAVSLIESDMTKKNEAKAQRLGFLE